MYFQQQNNVHVVKGIFQIPVFFLSIIYSIVIYIHKNCSLICKLKNLAYIQIKKIDILANNMKTWIYTHGFYFQWINACMYISGVDRLDKDLTIGQMQGNFLYP